MYWELNIKCHFLNSSLNKTQNLVFYSKNIYITMCKSYWIRKSLHAVILGRNDARLNVYISNKKITYFISDLPYVV